MAEKNTIAESIRSKAAEVDSFLQGLKAAGQIEERYLASARRDIANAFVWAERAVKD